MRYGTLLLALGILFAGIVSLVKLLSYGYVTYHRAFNDGNFLIIKGIPAFGMVISMILIGGSGVSLWIKHNLTKKK